MNRVLILFAHPRLEKSRANKSLLKYLPQNENVTFTDLYERYPDFNIDIEVEKELLQNHDIIIWHHPFYWYSCPPLLKQWIDLVLEFGWAYGPGGTALKDKIAFNVITTGGARQAYSAEGHNRFTIAELLAPFNQTATLCKMKYLPAFAVQGTHRLTDQQLEDQSRQYGRLIEKLSKGMDWEKLVKLNYLNDIFETLTEDN